MISMKKSLVFALALFSCVLFAENLLTGDSGYEVGLGYFTIESTFVGKALRGETLIEVVIDSSYLRPDIQKTLFQDGVLIIREILEESFFQMRPCHIF